MLTFSRIGRSGMHRITLTASIIGAAIASSRGDDVSDIASAKSLSRAFRSVAKRISPSVVKIRTTTHHALPADLSSISRQSSQGSSSTRYFDDPIQRPSAAGVPSRSGLGSGVIIEARGVILTNYHVVEAAEEVFVELADGKQFRAAEIKFDEPSDLAVIQIKVDRDLSAGTFGDSDKLEVGDWVLAVGHPFDLDLTFSTGIVSGKARLVLNSRQVDYFQTDAVINPGNSGGPLVNLDGEVVGINTAIGSQSGVYQGVGFAIPAKTAKWIAKQLLERGTVQRAYVGVRVEETLAEETKEQGTNPGRGVRVTEVLPDTPAAKAGLRNGDRIHKFAGQEVRNPRQLQGIVEQTESGTSQTVEIVRDGKPHALQITAGSLPKSPGLAGKILQAPIASTGSAIKELGINVADLSKADVERFGYAGFKGAIVKEVDPDGLAAQCGIRTGMLVRQVEKRAVFSAAEFVAAMRDRSLAEGVMLLIRTPDGGNRLVQLRKQ
jgi:serine protease Do